MLWIFDIINKWSFRRDKFAIVQLKTYNETARLAKKMKPTSLSIFFPAYNEEKNIEQAVKKAEEAILEIPQIKEFEIIVVNDGSADNTKVIAEKMAEQNERIRVVSHPKNLGYGEALKTGIKESRFDYIFFTDADLQFDISEIKKFIPYAPEYDAVIGFRQRRQDNFVRVINAKCWNIFNRLLLGLKFKDIDCAFKLFKKEALKNLNLKTAGAATSSEILAKLQRKGCKIKELPVKHFPRKQGAQTGAKLKVISRAFGEIFKLYREK